MIRVTIPLAAAALATSVAAAEQSSNARDRVMLKLDLGTRIEERCDARAGGEVAREHPGFAPDKVIAYAFATPLENGTEVIAKGAAVRSHGRWYRLSYRCRTTPDGLGIVAFDHTLGAEIPGWDVGKLATQD